MPAVKGLRVALVAGCPFPWARGTPARILGMAQALHDAGHDVHVVAYPLGQLERQLPFRVHRSPGLPLYARTAPGADPLRLAALLPMLAATTAKIVRRHRIDIVHAHHYEGLLAASPARRLSRVPVIYDAHTTLAGELPYYRHGLPRRGTVAVGRLLDRYLPRLVDHTVATSQHIAAELIADGIRPDRVTILGNGIEDAFVAEAIAPPSPETDGERIVYAGNLAGYQGIETLLEAFAVVAAKRPESRLVLLTETAFDRYRAQAERLGIADRITLETPPPPHALGTRLATATVLVNPRAECPGYPLKLLNYMAAGRAIVSFRNSARDLTHGRDAWLVDEPTPEALAAGLLEMLEQRQRAAALGASARRRVVQDLTWSRVAGRLELLYQELVLARRRTNAAAPAAYGALGGD
jgi:glycosyltransferase involved in cell wall biosynthesis